MTDGDTIRFPDIVIGKSLGAAARNYDILLPNGEVTQFTEGTRISNVEVTHGKGRRNKINVIDKLVDKYGGSPEEWQKVKGIGHVDFKGESYKAEIHWYQEENVGKVDWKVKPDTGGNWFRDD